MLVQYLAARLSRSVVEDCRSDESRDSGDNRSVSHWPKFLALVTTRHRLSLLTLVSILLATLVMPVQSKDTADYRRLGWEDLVPAADLEILRSPPLSLSAIPEGSAMESQDVLEAQAFEDPELARYLAALRSTNVVAGLGGTKVALPGYLVPLEYTEELKVVKLFIVPWFGACIHLPPPPPNQTVMGTFSEGFAITSLMTPLLFKGTIRATLTVDSLATATYALEIDSIEELATARY